MFISSVCKLCKFTMKLMILCVRHIVFYEDFMELANGHHKIQLDKELIPFFVPRLEGIDIASIFFSKIEEHTTQHAIQLI